MSNYLAIATATAALSQVLREAIRAEIEGADVTIARPHASTDSTNPETPTVNLYLYQVTPDAAQRNTDLPTRTSTGRLRQRPQVALNLHYLLTFYGDENALEPERLLGIAVRTLHAQPLLTRQRLRETIANESFPYLADSDLDNAVDLVKFTPIPFSLEELSKLWSVFLQTAYTLSVAYQGTVVLIESEVKPSTPLPVRRRNLYVLSVRQPVIEKIIASDPQGEPVDAIDPGVTLVIQGRRLKGDIITVRLGELEVTPEAENVSDTHIHLPLPDVPAEALRAGVRAVQVVHELSLGTPPTPHVGAESNVAAFILRPAISVSSQTTYDSVAITVTVDPIVGRNQRAVLLLNELSPGDGAAYSFVAERRTEDTHTLTFGFDVSEVKASDYLVRLQVDGAQSILQVANDAYTGPEVTIP